MIVVAAVIKKEGRFLLAQRKERTLNRRWEFPGGQVEFGESPEQALIREIKEELGVELKVGRCLGWVKIPQREPALLLAFEAELLSDSLVLSSHHQVAWVSSEELLSFDLLEADRELAMKLLKNDNP